MLCTKQTTRGLNLSDSAWPNTPILMKLCGNGILCAENKQKEGLTIFLSIFSIAPLSGQLAIPRDGRLIEVRLYYKSEDQFVTRFITPTAYAFYCQTIHNFEPLLRLNIASSA